MYELRRTASVATVVAKPSDSGGGRGSAGEGALCVCMCGDEIHRRCVRAASPETTSRFHITDPISGRRFIPRCCVVLYATATAALNLPRCTNIYSLFASCNTQFALPADNSQSGTID